MRKKGLALMLVTAMAMGMLSGCGDKPADAGASSGGTKDSKAEESSAQEADDSGQESSEDAGGQASGDLVPITWMMLDNDFEGEPTEVLKDVQEALRDYAGVEITFEGCDTQKLDLLLTGSELPDIITVNRNYCNTLLVGKKVAKLDDYLQYAPNLESLSPVRIAAMRKYYSNGDGGLYFWTPSVGNETSGAELWNGLTIRWDWYKELGCPEVKNPDEFLEVVKQIVDKHPTTENGDKVYGVATFSDGTLWGWQIPGAYWGYHNISDAYSMRLADDANEVVNNFTVMDSPVWHMIEYYYKANQMGIFDPDSLTMKSDDLNAKATNGQIVSPLCSWYGGSLYDNSRAEDPDSLAGYMVLPMEGQYNWDNGTSQIGWSYYTAASADTPYLEQIMKVFDFLNTKEGSRLAYMGKEGRVWETVDGKAVIKDEYVQMKLNGDPKEVSKNLSSMWGGMMGAANMTMLDDGGPVSLWDTPDIWKLTLNPLQKDFSEHYGVEVPAEAARNLIAEGKAYDFSAGTLAKDILSLIPATPADISRIDTRCTDIMIKAIPNLVLAADQAEYDRIKEETLAELEAADIQTSIQWWTEQSEEIREFLKSVNE